MTLFILDLSWNVDSPEHPFSPSEVLIRCQFRLKLKPGSVSSILIPILLRGHILYLLSSTSSLLSNSGLIYTCSCPSDLPTSTVWSTWHEHHVDMNWSQLFKGVPTRWCPSQAISSDLNWGPSLHSTKWSQVILIHKIVHLVSKYAA